MEKTTMNAFVVSTKLVILFFLIFTVSIAFGEGFNFTATEGLKIPLDLIFALIWIGLLMGFLKWRLIGGIASITGVVLFMALSGGVFADWFVWTMLIPGGMCILCWWFRRPFVTGKTKNA